LRVKIIALLTSFKIPSIDMKLTHCEDFYLINTLKKYLRLSLNFLGPEQLPETVILRESFKNFMAESEQYSMAKGLSKN
jgi:hypothetical protein